MSRLRNIAVAATAAVALLASPPSPAHACGPDFAIELLSERDATMLELQEGLFLDEVTRLVPASPYHVVLDPWDQPYVEPTTGTAVERALYRTGAEAFRAGKLAAAERAFVELLALPPAVRRHRSTWAAYMLGRIRGGDAAIAAYRQVRALADDGFADERGLAAASLGQEARLHLDGGEPGGVSRAIQLYAEQATLGGAGGDTSLLFVIRALVADRRDDELLAGPLGQRLLAVYLATRDAELEDEARTRLWARMTSIEHVAGADQLAAAAYLRGDWAAAARFAAAAADTARVRWVRAKLALRAGDRATADRLLADAAAGFATDRPACARIEGERATLALADGRVDDAMTHAWAARDTYVDAVYLAERVLTLDELTAFVARVAPGETAPVGPDASTFWGEVSPSLMRDLLGRRLMRAGRFTAALPYLVPSSRPAAVRYARALARSTVDDPIARASALYAASRVARRDGLEILGTSHAPDWSLYGAQYDPYGWRAWSDEPPPPRTAWHTAAEDARVAASAPVPEQRYHYRFIASRLAESAADLLPTRSQAFATTLCHAARYVRHRDPDRVDALYTRYLDDGPAYAMSFGDDCPAPQFERARRFLPPPPAPRWPMAAIAAVYLLGALWLLGHLRPGRFAARP